MHCVQMLQRIYICRHSLRLSVLLFTVWIGRVWGLRHSASLLT